MHHNNLEIIDDLNNPLTGFITFTAENVKFSYSSYEVLPVWISENMLQAQGYNRNTMAGSCKKL